MEKKPVFHIGMITRGKGELISAVDAIAYIFGKEWSSAYDGNTYDHSDKAGEVVHTGTLAPEELPAFVYQPYTLAHAVEWSEPKKNAQLFRHLYFSLPPEFTHEQQVALVHDFVQETFVAKGMIAMIAIHHKDGQQHAHILLTTRLLLPDGTWAPKAQHEPVLKNGKRVKGADGKSKRKKIHTTNWNRQDNGEKWRQMWATFTNKHYELLGFDTRIDHRSPKRQGLCQISPVYVNPADHQAEQRGERTEVGELNQWIASENMRRANDEARKQAIDKVVEAYLAKVKQLGQRKQWQSPQRRAMQQLWTDLHCIQQQFGNQSGAATTTTPTPQQSSQHTAQSSRRERGPTLEME